MKARCARIVDADTYTPAHREASRRRIADQLHEVCWMQTLAGRTRTAGAAPGILHDTDTDTDAARRIARFDTARDPGGALAFASLLVLADREEGAQFWLQFAADGGQATGAVCLYLLHLPNPASTRLSRTRSSTPPPAPPAPVVP